MRNKNLIIVLTAIVTALSFFFISFTFVARGLEDDAVEYATIPGSGKVDLARKQAFIDSIYNEPVYNFLGAEFTYKQVKELEMALGLDLQGGMHVVVEVSPVEILHAMAGSNASDANFKQAIANAKIKQRNSQNTFQKSFFEEYRALAGKDNLSKIFANANNKGKIDIRSTDSDVEKVINEEIDLSVERSFNILRNRIDKFGAIQPNIQRVRGTGRILVELPGVENTQRVRNLLQGTAKLEFMEVYQTYEVIEKTNRINEYLVSVDEENKSKLSLTPDSAATAAAASSNSSLLVDNGDTSAVAKTDSAAAPAQDTSKVSAFYRLAKGSFYYETKDTATINKILALDRVKQIIGSDLRFVWERKARALDNGGAIIELVPLKIGRDGKPALTGDVITNVGYGVSPGGKGYEVSMQMSTSGAREWRKITKAASQEQNKRRIAIVLDNAVYSAPQVNDEIPNGSSSITGNFTLEESKDLANILKAGKLPAPVRIVEEVVVGPTLGQEAIMDGLVSMFAGIIIVVLVLIMYYNKGGLVADIALLFNIVFTLGILASFNSVLTLPGIAGIVLTIGMSVDANILIMERIKEELANGKSLLTAIELGYDKAFSSIFDSNITTILTAVILFLLGEGPVKGFAMTLFWGVLCSFFTAVYITKVILLWMARNKKDDAISFDTFLSKKAFKNLSFNFIGKRKIAYFFSSAILVIGLVLTIMQGGLNLGVDFKGGRSYIVEFKNPVVASDIRSSLTEDFKGNGSEVKTYGSATKVKITTSYLVDDETAAADSLVATALEKGLTTYAKDNTFEVLSSSKVGATVADDIKNASWKAMLASLVGIFLYIFLRFKKWQLSLGGVIALFHDTLMVLAIFAILRVFNIDFEIDQVIIAALLTIVGFSINDTVVIFDRVREFDNHSNKVDMATMLNEAINSTLSRTIMTTVIVLISVLILFIFGGETLRGFSFSLLIGVVFGSYSTIFIAVPMLLDLRSKAEKEADDKLLAGK
ncbi:protein translocase subunit SecDF [Cytophaga aurantiaca]|uniref:protein translocase subunit SecDF n=1 Tax=Cytophaga aurantiaca TaxID=29530 RepID=UPI000380F7C3|nr:protein translocase subunit SecDF [Cytophaga aurantiaca]